MFRELRASFTLFAILFVLTGIGYPLLTYVAGQGLFPEQANGSLIRKGDVVIGSSLIGQNFSGDTYFHPRPSAAGNGYDAANSSGSNLPASSADLAKAVSGRVGILRVDESIGAIPVDMVTASASGLDPDISVAAAHFQIGRVARARNVPVAELEKLIEKNTTGRDFGILGEARVNVLQLNRALDLLPEAVSQP